jgi:tRNA A37 methylthiotransferase MiaB
MIDIPDPHITVFDQEVKEPIKTETYSTEEHWEYWAAKQGYKIRVDEGCLGNCSFCVTRIATKRLTSIPIDTILSAFQEGIMKGYKTFLFTGDDTGAYGQDIGCTIVDLLTKILAVPGDYSVFFHDFNINWLMKYQDQLIPLFKANIPRLGCFNFPIQGSTDRILKLMRRPYTIAPVLECVKRLRHEAPGFKIGTHYVVGFPGETEAEIEGFIQLINECDFEFLVVFRYSDNPRADSSKLPNKIEKEIIEERASRVFNAFNQNYQKTHKKISNDIDIK